MSNIDTQRSCQVFFEDAAIATTKSQEDEWLSIHSGCCSSQRTYASWDELIISSHIGRHRVLSLESLTYIHCSEVVQQALSLAKRPVDQ